MATILERNKDIKPKKKTYQEHAQDALYREVWEEVNNDKTVEFLKKYSRQLIIAALALLIIVTGVQIGIRTYRANKMAVATNYETAIENIDANALAAIAKNSRGATSDLALFQAYLLDKDFAKIETLANNGHTRDFRDLAKIHVVSINGDKMSAIDVEKYLSDMNTKSSPFYYTSRLVVAQKYLASGDRDNANKWLDKIISDTDCPAVISATAQTLK